MNPDDIAIVLVHQSASALEDTESDDVVSSESEVDDGSGERVAPRTLNEIRALASEPVGKDSVFSCKEELLVRIAEDNEEYQTLSVCHNRHITGTVSGLAAKNLWVLLNPYYLGTAMQDPSKMHI